MEANHTSSVLATLSFRRRVVSLPDLMWFEDYIATLLNWFKYRKFDVVAHTLGVHRNSSYPHFHLHFIVTCDKILSNPMSSFKYDMAHGKITIQLPFKETPISEVLGQDRWTSIRMKSQSNNPDATNDWVPSYLGYVLKENNEDTNQYRDNPLLNNVGFYGIDLAELTCQSHKIYKSAIKNRNTKMEREAKQLTEWETICQIADACPQDFTQICLGVLTHYRDNIEVPPHPRAIIQKVEKYCFKKGIFSFEQLIDKYRF